VSRESAFTGRTAAILAGVAAVSLAASFALGIFSDAVVDNPSAGADGFSRSALGHRAVLELLGALDIPVLQSQYDTAGRVGDAALLVIEPQLNEDSEFDPEAELRDMLHSCASSLVVLPKWQADYDPALPDRVARVSRVGLDEATNVLERAGITGAVVRPTASSGWVGADESWTDEPTLLAPQLVNSEMLEPLISSEQGVLFGYYEMWDGQYVYILSDPDVLSNHGLGRGDNALVATAIIEEVRRGTTGSLLVDETLHGFRRPPSLWRALFEFPLALASLQVFLAVGLLLWAAVARFGKPTPPRPPFAPGKEFLIDNIAALSRFGGHTDLALDRYLEVALQDVAVALHAPRRLRGDELHRWLDQVAATRNVGASVGDLQRAVTNARNKPRAAVAAANRIHEWRQELTHGSHVHSERR